MTPSSSTADVRHARTVLSSPTLIRLITEIDDNGPIPPRGLAATLADLSAHHLRQTTDLARALGLVRVRPGVGLALTMPGVELADVYDATARWARRHAYPAQVADFTSRIQHTLALLTEPPVPAAERGSLVLTAEPRSSAEAAADLTRLRDLLHQWLHANPQATRLAEPEPAA